MITVLLWGLAWLGISLVAAGLVGRAVHLADIELEVARAEIPDRVPEEWIAG